MELKKELGFLDVFSIASGAMISSGIFILPGIAFGKSGPAVFFSYFLAGILAMLGVFSTAELATAMPKAGGDYYFINRSLGPLIGTISGLLSWIALSLKTAFAIYGLSEVIHIFTGFNLFIISISLCLIFLLLNIKGVKEAAKLEVILVIALLFLMVLYIVLGASKVNLNYFEPIAPNGFNSVIMTTGFIFISFGGLLNIASVSEEVKNPKVNIPFAMFLSVLTITILYTLMLIVTVGILPGETLASSITPIADTAKLISGDIGYIVITIAAALAFITTANAGIMAASRYPLALSRDKLLPKKINSLHKRFNTPIKAILITGTIIILSLLLQLELLVKVASTVVLTSYVLTNIAVIILRESKVANYKPSFKAPLYPWVQILSIAVFTFFIIDLGFAAAEISIGLLIIAISIYFFYGKKHTDKEYALLHLLERITDKKLTSHSLEDELREIVREREEIAYDEFDFLVKDAEVIDLQKRYTLAEFLERVSKDLSKFCDYEQKEIFDLLIKREMSTSTALSDFVAVPHIVLEKSKGFKLLVYRSKDGLEFSDIFPNIKAIFVFIGTPMERRLHLKILASIIYIVQEVDFDRRWVEAKNENYLRDLLLTSKRTRKSN